MPRNVDLRGGDVAPDGRRFLMIKDALAVASPPRSMIVVSASDDSPYPVDLDRDLIQLLRCEPLADRVIWAGTENA